MVFLYFRLFKCTNLRKGDLLSENDVYCKLNFQGNSKFTCIKENDANPEWEENATFIFPFDPSKNTTFEINIYDSDGFKSDLLATVNLNVSDAMWESKMVTTANIEARYSFVYVCSELDIKKIKYDAVELVFDKMKQDSLNLLR